MKVDQQLIKNDDLNDTNVLKMFPEAKLLTAPKGPDHNDWLSKLSVGTVFVAKAKPELRLNPAFLQEYLVVFKFTKAVKLAMNDKDPEQVVNVDPSEFSKQFDLFEILHVPKEDE